MKTLGAGVEGWVLGYLLNALWQGPLVLAAAWCAAWLARRVGPGAVRLEHRVWVAALALEAVLPACMVRGSEVWSALRGLFAWGRRAGEGSVSTHIGPAVVAGAGVLRLPKPVLAGAMVAYGVGLAYCVAKLAWAAWRTDGMRRGAEGLRLAGRTEASWRRASQGLAGRTLLGIAVNAPELAVSAVPDGPVTVGIWRPAVLVPEGFLEGVDDGDLEALLEHECAHLRRWDFAKNLVYGVVALPVAWHPAVGVTRARLAESREMVCDATAAEAVAGRERYARSLLRLASLVAEGGRVRELNAIGVGIFDANTFERRVMNLTRGTKEVGGVQRAVMTAACAVVLAATCATAVALRMEVAPAVMAASAAGTGNMTIPAGELAKMSLYKKMPQYPAEAKANKDTLDGPVVLAVTIGRDGGVEAIHVVESLRQDYDSSALEAVKDWKWRPYLLNGQPVAVDSTVTVTYSIDHTQN